MREPIIEVEQISKVFPIELRREVQLRQEFTSMMQRLFQPRSYRIDKQFHALRNISFTVGRGEGFAIIGRNGAGKSTLLRVIANILEPSTGHVRVHGQFATLLGLGPGFNPELSGRENLYLGGAFMKIRPNQMNDLIEEIADFAELGDFLDAPLKVYSSGMMARLGFSLVLHALPEIILVDEVIAVGDSAFQAKCTERLQSLIAEGRTLLLVSHSTQTIRTLCQRAVWLDLGEARAVGAIDDVLQAYESHLEQA